MDFRKALALIAAVGFALTIFYTPLAYPFLLLTTVFHEVGHALAVLVSGGTVDGIVINANGSGYCRHAGGAGFWQQVLISSAGYLGSAVEGSFLLFLTLRLEKGGRIVLIFLSAALLAVCALWTRNVFGLVTTLGLAVAIGLCAWRLPAILAELVAIFLSSYVALYAVSAMSHMAMFPIPRVPGGVRGVGLEMGMVLSDQDKLANLTNIPPMFWAVVWLAFALLALVCAVWLGVRRRSGGGGLFGQKKAKAPA